MDIKAYIKDVSFINPIYDRSKCIPVILVCDDRNVAETMVTVLSISEIEDDFYYDIVIIHNTLDEYDIAAFEFMSNSLDTSKLKLRFERIEHDFTKGYIHIDMSYKKEYVLKCFLPVILKRYGNFLYVRSGNILKAGISQLYNSFIRGNEVKVIGVGKLAEVVMYDSIKFRMKYSVANIKDSMTRGIRELDKEFLRKLSGSISFELPDGIVEIYDEECPSMSFKKLISRVPYFERWLYGWNNRIDITDNDDKLLNTEFYLFPFELVQKGEKVALYGNGRVGHQFRQQIKMTHYCELIAVVDRDVREGILAPSKLADLKFDHVIIAIANENVANEIRNNLMLAGIRADKIIYAKGRKL